METARAIRSSGAYMFYVDAFGLVFWRPLVSVPAQKLVALFGSNHPHTRSKKGTLLIVVGTWSGGFISAVESWMSTDGRNPAPVEVGSLSHYLQGFRTIPGGDRRTSEPSTVAFNFWFKFGLMLSIPGPIINIWSLRIMDLAGKNGSNFPWVYFKI